MALEPSIFWIMLAAFLLELAIGYPSPVWRRIGHPVSWVGHVIAKCDVALNSKGQNKTADLIWGGATLILLLVLVGGSALLISFVSDQMAYGWLVQVLVCATLLAGGSLRDHVAAVACALEQGGLEAGREKIALIVGRNPHALDEPAICRAAVETLAENTSDGVVAPLFWGLVAGLPGIAVYKAVNTADSMIGHRSQNYEWFGKAAARLDDFMNLIPARLTGILFAIVALSCRRLGKAFKTMWRDAPRHVSPNAGWPEAAMAAALDCRLGGPRIYQGVSSHDAVWLGQGKAEIGMKEVAKALDLYRISMGLIATLLFLAGLLANRGVI